MYKASPAHRVGQLDPLTLSGTYSAFPFLADRLRSGCDCCGDRCGLTVRALLILAAEKPKPPKVDIVHPVAHGLVESRVAFWPLWVLVGLIALGKLAHQLYRKRRLARSGIAE